MQDPPGDNKYYQVAKPHAIAERLVIRARAQIFRDFMARCRPDREDTILDGGVSDVVGQSPTLLERLYPHRDRIIALGQAGLRLGPLSSNLFAHWRQPGTNM